MPYRNFAREAFELSRRDGIGGHCSCTALLGNRFRLCRYHDGYRQALEDIEFERFP